MFEAYCTLPDRFGQYSVLTRKSEEHPWCLDSVYSIPEYAVRRAMQLAKENDGDWDCETP